jgi:hypothetical protein
VPGCADRAARLPTHRPLLPQRASRPPTAGLAPFLALAPLFNDQLLAFLDGNTTSDALGCACGELLGAPAATTSPRVCRAVLRFLYNM